MIRLGCIAGMNGGRRRRDYREPAWTKGGLLLLVRSEGENGRVAAARMPVPFSFSWCGFVNVEWCGFVNVDFGCGSGSVAVAVNVEVRSGVEAGRKNGRP